MPMRVDVNRRLFVLILQPTVHNFCVPNTRHWDDSLYLLHKPGCCEWNDSDPDFAFNKSKPILIDPLYLISSVPRSAHAGDARPKEGAAWRRASAASSTAGQAETPEGGTRKHTCKNAHMHTYIPGKHTRVHPFIHPFVHTRAQEHNIRCCR